MDQFETRPAMPKQLKTAVILFYSMIAINFIITILVITLLASTASPEDMKSGAVARGVSILFMSEVLVALILGLLAYKLSQGREWARITFVFLCSFGILGGVMNHGKQIANFVNIFQSSAIFSGASTSIIVSLYSLLRIATWVMTIIGIVLLYQKTSSAYFAKPGKA